MCKKTMIEICTSGAYDGDPRPGGWGAVIRWGAHEKEICGGELDTTNNRMELMAAIAGLEALTRPMAVRLTTDSTYVKDGITKWIHGWKKNGWKTAAKKPVKNAELWKRLEAGLETHDVGWHWVKGHSDHPENDRADALARQGMAHYMPNPK